ncbi:matrixin family metalloprotease [Nocardioides sp.]|uniref:matrixin family metalloprotease n=1 Tax=Nocardioides sp. TaxID=35761 RepID=UPI00263013FF|nr:matrixin family metalloprotease [Nocardioides sp.]
MNSRDADAMGQGVKRACHPRDVTVSFDNGVRLAAPAESQWVMGYIDAANESEQTEVGLYRTTDGSLVGFQDGSFFGRDLDIAEARASHRPTKSGTGAEVDDYAQRLQGASLASLRLKEAERRHIHPPQGPTQGTATTPQPADAAPVGISVINDPQPADKCSAAAPYALSGTTQTSTLVNGLYRVNWAYNSAGNPGLLASNVNNRLHYAAWAWNSIYAQCGIAHYVLLETVRGANSTTAHQQSLGNCLSRPTANVIAWANFGSSTTVLAQTCLWGDGRFSIALNSAQPWAAVDDIGPSCSGKYDLESVLVHEWGHALGLNHVSTYHQAMAPTIAACWDNTREIGRGDWNGVRAMYGAL